MFDAATRSGKLDDGFVTLDGRPFYRIRDFESLGPFLINVVSASDLWMFLSSYGGLTAGRVNPDQSLFAYETVDRLHHAHQHTGPLTVFQVRIPDQGREFLWEPFQSTATDRTRNLYKSLAGNEVVFEEIVEDAGLTFRYGWTSADDLGFIRSSTIRNGSDVPLTVELLDGLRNLQPWGLSLGLLQSVSCLTDAYKQSEIDPASGLGIFASTAAIVDGTHPTEVLRANVVWQCGLSDPDIGLSAKMPVAFRRGQPIDFTHVLKGLRGNYFARATLGTLSPGEARSWYLVADVGLGHVQLAALRDRLIRHDVTPESIEASIAAATEQLQANVAASDGLQQTADADVTAHHFSNVLFNNMRGGVFVDEADVVSSDLTEFFQARNRVVFERYRDHWHNPDLRLCDLRKLAATADDVDLRRLVDEFLPLTFSRRHGDPSRPWNRFSIELKKPDGTQALRYQGNWRDIFQNWEALCVSHPKYFDQIVAKFVNGSTVDGFNPYRVTERGMEWEVPDPDDPWSNIGYWGDHQIIYLLKLLEALQARRPERLHEMLASAEFVYLNVPYRLKPYAELTRDVRNTVLYDKAAEQQIEQRMATLGEDGKLVTRAGEESIAHVTLAEKLTVPLLSKLSNLVVGGGIWMNTQRPEWNDANNALVGNGLSVVTLGYVLRYAKFLRKLLEQSTNESFAVSREVASWLRATCELLERHRSLLTADNVSSSKCRSLIDELGQTFCDYRRVVYERGMSEPESLPAQELTRLCDVAAEFAEHTLRCSKRDDGLFHAYNLADFSEDGRLPVHHLYEMLEGQVSVLSSGMLSVREAADLVETMFDSRLYRPDQHSFMLYPERELPGFLEKNCVPAARVSANPLLTALLQAGDPSVILQDGSEIFRFHPSFQTAVDLQRQLDRLQFDSRWSSLVSQHKQETIKLYEDVFEHHFYTGRSGTMYGYEGLGCIYWHMVAKLLLAIQENYFVAAGNEPDQADRLARLYYRVRSGLGFAKEPAEFGAFPMDAYSHTPRHSGAQQPGMTGQVKEEILTRFGELGLRIDQGCLSFQPSLLRADEFLKEPGSFHYFREGHSSVIPLPAGSLAFTYCQLPIVYELTDNEESIRIVLRNGGERRIDGRLLDRSTTSKILDRDPDFERLHIGLRPMAR